MKRLLILATFIMVVIGLFAMPVAAQQAGVVWTTSFFNNPYLTGNPVYTQQDSAINMNWGNGSPNANVPVDNFSARLATDVNFAAGTYRFYILADDGVTFYLDFQQYINTWDQTRPNQLLTVDIPLSAGNHHIQIDYKEISSVAFIYVDWANLATNPTGPRFQVPAPVLNPTPAPTVGGPWTAEYYNNVALSGSPVAIIGEATPTHNWGAGAPLASVPADNFSARYRLTQYMDGGSYQLSVRADDGIRVYLDNALVINEWHNATNQTYTVNVTPPAGNHTITVEYYEAAGLAFLEYNLTRVGTTPPVYTPPANTSATAVVTTGMLNVREIPDPINGRVLTRIRQNTAYTVTGRNASSTWWQLNVNGIIGWVNGNYISVTNAQLVPVVGTTTPTTPPPSVPTTGYTLSTTANVNLRSLPSTRGAILQVVPRNTTAQIVGRNAANSWWQISVNGRVGWISAAYALPQYGINLAAVPVNG